jgi:putative transposase
MERSKFSDEQIVGVLKQAELGVPVKELIRKYGVSEATFYAWRKKYGGLSADEMKRLKQLEQENRDRAEDRAESRTVEDSRRGQSRTETPISEDSQRGQRGQRHPWYPAEDSRGQRPRTETEDRDTHDGGQPRTETPMVPRAVVARIRLRLGFGEPGSTLRSGR